MLLLVVMSEPSDRHVFETDGERAAAVAQRLDGWDLRGLRHRPDPPLLPAGSCGLQRSGSRAHLLCAAQLQRNPPASQVLKPAYDRLRAEVETRAGVAPTLILSLRWRAGRWHRYRPRRPQRTSASWSAGCSRPYAGYGCGHAGRRRSTPAARPQSIRSLSSRSADNLASDDSPTSAFHRHQPPEISSLVRS
jgi:hypothetical protein